MIIGGSVVGAFISANSKETIGQALSGLGAIFRGPKYIERDYLELLTLLYQVFRLAKTKGMLALEQHVDNPEESSLFTQFPNVVKDRHARSEEHTSELQSLMRTSYAVFCLNKKKHTTS